MSERIADSPQDQDRLQEILLGYVEAVEAGAAPDRQEILAAHPEFAIDLQEFWASYHQINKLATPLRDSEARRTGLDAIQMALKSAKQGGSTAPGVSGGLPGGELGQLGDYRLLREIGRGGMGVVYEAEQISLRRRVALKILPFAGGADSRQLQRFRNEAEAAAHLHHSHIVPVFAVGAERGVHFYAMQFIEGQSLAAVISNLSSPGVRYSEPRGSEYLTPGLANTVAGLSTERSSRSQRFFQTVATIGKQAAEALDYAHQMGVVHRDIKPANLLIDGRGDMWIADFGLAQFTSQVGLTMSGEVLGTLRYASPEQAMARRGVVDHRTDIYSLAATLYELLTLKPVFDGADRHVLLQQIGFDEPVPPRVIDHSIPVELETIVLKALAKSPTDRYGSAQELADDLQRFLDDKPIQATRPSLFERARKWGRRHPSFVAASVLLLVFGLIGFAVSTVVISREQANTLAALHRVKLEEELTKKAFDKLAVEETRTKNVNKNLEAEQARTKEALKKLEVAYAAEEMQRSRAEWDFLQAQRAIELVVQFSEGELSQDPRQQDVRRRLLLTVRDYYEDFLQEHADDPALQKGRERVAFLVAELSQLRGTTLITIIREGNVQNDLELTDEQKKRVTAYLDKTNKQPNPKDKGGFKGFRPMESAASVEKALGEILDPDQLGRFQEIVLQVQNQGRYGFTEPKIVEKLKLTTGQRERIRQIQNDTHKTWADHVFSPKKVKTPAEFWAGVQEQVLAVLEADQRRQWQEMAGAPITVDFREGYPFDGRNVDASRPFGGFEFPHPARGLIAVQTNDDRAGSGFGHKVFMDDKQCYAWAGKEIAPTAFEIAVTANPLTDEERKHLLTKGDRAPMQPIDPQGWVVLFRSPDPSVWNTDSPDDPAKFAIPVSRAPRNINYLRLKRMDTGEIQIVAIRHAELIQTQKAASGQDYVWNGAANDAFRARHLGIAETRPMHGFHHKGQFKKDGPGKGGTPAKN